MNGNQRRSLRAAARKASEALMVVVEQAEGLDGEERDEISHVRFLCQQIEDGER